MAGHGNDNIDILRKGTIVAVLVGGLWLLHRFGTGDGGIDPTAMLALGFVVLASYTFGELVGAVKLPHITGYLLAGLLLGPSAAEVAEWVLVSGPEWFGTWIGGFYAEGSSVGADVTVAIRWVIPDGFHLPPPFDKGVLNATEYHPETHEVVREGVLDQLQLFNILAVALIALTAGGELKIAGLKQGLKTILGALGGQTVVITATVMLFTIVISGLLGDTLALPFLNSEIAALGGLDTVGVLLMGGVLASISIATSPAATIAVINGTRSKGPTTSTILSSVVLKDVIVVLLFSVITAVAAAWIDPSDVVQMAGNAMDAAGHAADAAAHGHADAAGHGAPEGQSLTGFILELLWHIVGSLVIGLLVGLGISAYLRYIGVEILLFLVGTVFALAFLGQAAGLDTTLLFIAAGFAATNFSKEGDQLIHEVEKLGMPVYVVFFTLTGAGLHLDTLVTLAPFAGALVLARGIGIWGGMRAGLAVTGAPEPVKRHAWLGYFSQAGVAIALAGLVASRFGDTGRALSDLIIAGVAVHEVVGPILLKVALGLAGDLPKKEGEEDSPEVAEGPDPDVEFSTWTPRESLPDPWGPAPKTAAPALDRLAVELRADLEALVMDVQEAVVAELVAEAEEYLDDLRREFLRHHRHLVVAVEEDPASLMTRIRAEQASLADRWRDVVLSRSADVGSEGWTPMVLVEAADDLVAGMPERVRAPYESRTLAARSEDSAPKALQRGLFRAWHRVASILGGTPPTRSVPVQTVANYHLAGLLPGRLEALAAVMVSGEQHLHRRTRNLFDTVSHAYDCTVKATEEQADLSALLAAIRRDVDAEFALARDEIQAIAKDCVGRTAIVLGETWRGFVEDLPEIATLDLPTGRRRYSRVFNQRTKGIQVLERGLTASWKSTAARYDGLALELELVKLEGRVKDLVDQHGDQLARNVRGKGLTQVVRVQTALRDSLIAVQTLLGEPLTADELSRGLRDATAPLDRVAEEAARAADRLREQLADDQALSPMLDALLLAARDLTERYTVPVGPERHGEWVLPPPSATTEVPFREVVNAFIESSVTRDLSELTRELAAAAQGLATTLEEFDRLVAFNVELAAGELELVDGDVPDDTRELVREMVVGNLTRARTRLQELEANAEAWGKRAEKGVNEAVLGELDKLRAQVQEGKVSELRMRLLREAAAGRRMVRRAGGLTGLAAAVVDTAGEIARGTLGPEGLAEAQRVLGLPSKTTEQRPDPSTFAEERPAIELPMVYRRLFSDVAMEAGDLLTGRRKELDRARRILDGDLGGRLRSVALVGPAGVGKRALVSALIRKVDTRDVRRISLTHDVTAEEVETWFEDDVHDRLNVIEGFSHMYTMEPGGMGPLRAFARGLVRDDGRNRWLVHSHTPMWRFANRVAELSDAFADVVELEPLDTEGMANAILARHAMSGYDLRFVGDPGLAWQVRALLRPGSTENRSREAWFAALHSTTGGLLNDALRLWMASIVEVDEKTGAVVIGDIPEGPLEALRGLPDDDLLTLRQVARQGAMSASTHAWLFRSSLVAADAHLGHLAHLGLLERSDDGYALSAHLQGAVARILDERGWTE